MYSVVGTALSENYVFASLAESDIVTLIAAMQIISIGPNENIITQGKIKMTTKCITLASCLTWFNTKQHLDKKVTGPPKKYSVYRTISYSFFRVTCRWYSMISINRGGRRLFLYYRAGQVLGRCQQTDCCYFRRRKELRRIGSAVQLPSSGNHPIKHHGYIILFGP
jgi:hypothetical protein